MGDGETLGAYLQRWIEEVVRGTVKQSTLEKFPHRPAPHHSRIGTH